MVSDAWIYLFWPVYIYPRLLCILFAVVLSGVSSILGFQMVLVSPNEAGQPSMHEPQIYTNKPQARKFSSIKTTLSAS